MRTKWTYVNNPSCTKSSILALSKSDEHYLNDNDCHVLSWFLCFIACLRLEVVHCTTGLALTTQQDCQPHKPFIDIGHMSMLGYSKNNLSSSSRVQQRQTPSKGWSHLDLHVNTLTLAIHQCYNTHGMNHSQWQVGNNTRRVGVLYLKVTLPMSLMNGLQPEDFGVYTHIVIWYLSIWWLNH